MRYSVFFTLLVLSFLTTNRVQAQQSPLLLVDPQGHASKVEEVLFTPDGQTLISVSLDKSIRFWDTHSGELRHTLRGQIESGPEGSLFAAALSPNGRWLATGGYGFEGGLCHINIIDIHRNQQVTSLKGHDNVISSLMFSDDGRWLLSSSGDKTIRFWEIADKPTADNFATCKRVLKQHRADIYDLDLSPDGKTLISCSQDSTIAIWEVGQDSVLLKKVITAHKDKVQCLAFSPEGGYFVTGGMDNRVFVWDKAGNFIRQLVEMPGDIGTLEFSPDGKLLLVHGELKNPGEVYAMPEGRLVATYKEHDNTVIASAFSPLKTAEGHPVIASGGGHNYDIYIWNAITGETIHHLCGSGRPVFSVAFGQGLEVGFGNTLHHKIKYNDLGPLTRSFNFSTLGLTRDGIDEKAYKRVEPTHKGRYLQRIDDYTLKVSNDVMIRNSPLYDQKIRCYSFTPNGEVIVGSSASLKMYSSNGELLKNFVGHTALIWSVSVSEDGEYLASGSGDQTIRLWSLDTAKQEPLLATLYVGSDNEWICWLADNHYSCSKDGGKLIGFHVNNGLDTLANYYPFEQFDLKLNRPDILLERLGSNDDALIRSIRKAYEKRLEKMGFSLEMLSDELHLPQLSIANEADIPTESNQKILNFDLRAFDNRFQLNRINLWVNDVPVYGRSGIAIEERHSRKFSKRIPVDLGSGRNKIQFSVLNNKGVESLKKTFFVDYIGATPQANLHIIAIGVSEYQNSAMNLNYARKDAMDIITFFKAHNNHIYDSIYVHKYLNQSAKKANILAVKEQLIETKAEDRVILFYAGHGLLDADLNYYLATYDVDFTDPAKKGLPYDQLEALLDGIPARNKLMLVDACHSGEIDKSEMELTEAESDRQEGEVKFRNVGEKVARPKHFGLENSFRLMKELFADLRRSSGATVIASAGGGEYALEGDQWQNGVFTYSMLSGLEAMEGDQNQDGQINLSELQGFLAEKVYKLTDGMQKPASRIENIENDFVVYALPQELRWPYNYRRLNLAAMKEMIDKDIDVNMLDTSGYAALHIAAYNKAHDMVELLLRNGADPNIKDPNGNVPLNFAMMSNDVEINKMIMDAGGKPTIKNSKGYSAIDLAEQAGLPFLISLYKNPEATYEIYQRTEKLYKSIEINDNETFDNMLLAGVDVNATYGKALSPLMYTVAYDRDSMFAKLMTKQPDLDHVDGNGWTALMLAVKRNNLSMCVALYSAGASLDMKNSEGQTARDMASAHGFSAIVNFLNNPYEISKHYTYSKKLLEAAKNGDLEAAKRALKDGAEINFAHRAGSTPLSIAVDYNQIEVAQYLLKKDANPDVFVYTVYGKVTLVMLAVLNNNLGMCKLLCKAGANLRLKNDKGETALILARQLKYQEIIKCLERYD